MKRRSTFLFPLAVMGSLLGCGDNGLGEPAAIQASISLENFASCEALEQYIEDQAVQDMKMTLEGQKEGGWAVFGRGGVLEDRATSSPSASSAPSAYTKTNTQVAGVDEADFVKNDGTRIFMISGQKLFAVKSWPADKMAIAGSLTLEGYPTQMYLDEKNRVVVFSQVYTKYDGFAENGGNSGGVAPCAADTCGYYYSNTTKVTVVDVADLANPKVQAETYLPGSYANSRRIDSSVRVVLSDYFRWPATVKFYPDYVPGLYDDKARLASALESLKVSNEQVIRAQTLKQWLPVAKRRLAGGALVDLPYNCGDFHKSNASTHLGLATVATVNLDTPDAAPSRTSVLGEVGEIYASTTALYVSSPHWWWWPRLGQKDWTYIHKFDLTDKNKARYVASGGVEGHIVDQFSMDEHKGFFRIATTTSNRVPDTANPANTWGTIETSNRINVLREAAGRLELNGQSEEVAKGERIYSSRFVGDRGFVVTFRQVDPLFTFDLSNPAAPRRVGELKVPGFSTYIHPVDANHLLTIGVYQPDPNGGVTNWQERRMQLSLFDVTDFANPKQKFTQLVGTAYGWSEAAYEHKAFNYFPERKLLAIPFSDYVPVSSGDPWGQFTSELRVYNVDVNTGFSVKGALSMKDVYISSGTPDWRYWYSPWIRRSVMATDAGTDYVYAISDAGIRAATGPSLNTTLSTINFPRTPFN